MHSQQFGHHGRFDHGQDGLPWVDHVTGKCRGNQGCYDSVSDGICGLVSHVQVTSIHTHIPNTHRTNTL